jgi:hypothetical protein
MPNFHELELLAAQAWAAAGDTRRAKAFARDLVDNATASAALRVQALAILGAAVAVRGQRAAAPRCRGRASRRRLTRWRSSSPALPYIGGSPLAVRLLPELPSRPIGSSLR